MKRLKFDGSLESQVYFVTLVRAALWAESNLVRGARAVIECASILSAMEKLTVLPLPRTMEAKMDIKLRGPGELLLADSEHATLKGWLSQAPPFGPGTSLWIRDTIPFLESAEEAE